MAGRQSTAAMETFHLPFDITLDILSRLPVKSLLRFKSVCKTWYALVESPNFVAKHLQTQSSLSPTSLLTTTYNLDNPYLLTQNYYMSLVNDDVNNGPLNLDFPFLQSRNYLPISERKYFSVWGICNGLVCITVCRYGHPLICNPSTRQFREIPGAEWIWSSGPITSLSFGFGFHPSTNDYQLITIRTYFSPLGKYNIRADLYTISTDTWREIDVNKLSLFFREMDVNEEWDELVRIFGNSAATVINGVFYWPALFMETNQVGVMSFDMGDEVFRKIRMPESLDITPDKTNWRLMELNDKLALIVSPDQTGFGVWVLNENETSWTTGFGVWVLNENETSWTNQVNVESFPMIATNMRSGEEGKITVVGGGKNGELLVIAHKASGDLKLFMYAPKTQETKDLCSCQVPYASCVYLCTETLLPVMQPNEVVLV